jgi:CBS domain-containing protein
VFVADLSPMTSPKLAAIAETASVRIAARALSQLDIGMLVVCNEGGPIAGIVSRSDLVRHLASGGTSDDNLGPVMTRNVITCSIHDELQMVCQKMVAQHLKNAPVLNDQARPVGVLDIRDALRVLLQAEQYEEQLLVNYVSGHGYQ